MIFQHLPMSAMKPARYMLRDERGDRQADYFPYESLEDAHDHVKAAIDEEMHCMESAVGTLFRTLTLYEREPDRDAERTVLLVNLVLRPRAKGK